MARARLLHVPGDECGQAATGRALRFDLEPQFRRPPGPWRPHAFALTSNGRCRSRHRPLDGCPNALGVTGLWALGLSPKLFDENEQNRDQKKLIGSTSTAVRTPAGIFNLPSQARRYACMSTPLAACTKSRSRVWPRNRE